MSDISASKKIELMGKGLAYEKSTRGQIRSAGEALIAIAPEIESLQAEVEQAKDYCETLTNRCIEDTKRIGELEAAIIEHKELMRSWNQGMGVSHVNNKLWSHIESLEGGW